MKRCERFDLDDFKTCCERLKRECLDYRIHLDYEVERNIYYIPEPWPHSSIRVIWFCPWCAAQLPRGDLI